MPLEYASQTEFPASIEKPLAEKHRCRYTNNRGQRCPHRLIDSSAGLCTIHQRQRQEEKETQAQNDYEDLFNQAGQLETRDEVRQVLTQLLRSATLGTIPKDKAALLAYTCSLVLQTLPLRSRTEDDDFSFFRDVLPKFAPAAPPATPPATPPAAQDSNTNPQPSAQPPRA